MENYEYPFEKLRVYQESRRMVASIYKLLQCYPSEEKYALCAQMRRCAVSVSSNIAEGTSRTSYRDKLYFLETSYGSLMELYSQLQVSFDLGYISAEVYTTSRQWITNVAQPLSGLRNSYLKQIDKP